MAWLIACALSCFHVAVVGDLRELRGRLERLQLGDLVLLAQASSSTWPAFTSSPESER